MARYIDADKLYEEMLNSIAINALEVIKKQPTEDVAPVVHAHWIHPFSNDIVQCSNCENYFQDKVNVHSAVYHYCPCCGAKMDEEAEE